VVALQNGLDHDQIELLEHTDILLNAASSELEVYIHT
jgi:hypothetical protein